MWPPPLPNGQRNWRTDFYTMFEELKFSLSLGSDNHSGVHPRVMEALQAANRGHAHAYGMDELCQLATVEFKRAFGPEVEAQYVFTGTAANVLSMATQVRSFEAVICSEQAHLHLDECGAPEKFLGTKLWPLPSRDGKIAPEQCESLLQRMGDQHFSQPKCVSLTLPSEFGVCYSLDELREWRRFTKERNLMLHLDGARLANAAAFLDVSLEDLTRGVGADVVSLGGSKNGLMGAEAVLLFTPAAKQAFKFYRKQAMQLSSKTRFLAAQFYAYLKDDLWRQIAEHSTGLARDLEERLRVNHPDFKIALPVQSNALFVHVPKTLLKDLRERFFFYIWDSDTQLCRWMISWDWTAEHNQKLLTAITEVKTCSTLK
ncbi:MAG: threonine aldolase [Bdellovibrionales bacterium]|nr:threonine aldolase [Bdellovibrionales bacterium]